MSDKQNTLLSSVRLSGVQGSAEIPYSMHQLSTLTPRQKLYFHLLFMGDSRHSFVLSPSEFLCKQGAFVIRQMA